jgi:hypothetical protein
LRVRASGGDGFDATYTLSSANWRALKRGNGWKSTNASPIKLALLKTGKLLRIVGAGALSHTLASQPDAVDVQLVIGAQTYCMTFGGDVTFKAGKSFRAKNAPAPASCAAP